MQNLSNEMLQTVIAQLDQALYNHEQWYKNLLRVLIAHVPPDVPDLMPDAHCNCRFGQWYYSDASECLRKHTAFASLGQAHEKMHESARQLLQRIADGLPISVSDLDQFNNVLDRMRLEIQSLGRELTETMQNRDPLTGARTRAGLLPYLREQQAMVRRGVQKCFLTMLDIDHFKNVNDTYGHSVGDAVLASTVQSLQALLRPYDRLYRYGGEEFLLCMPNAAADTALGMAERLRAAVAAQNIHYNKGNDFLQVTASFGVAVLDPSHPVEDSIDRADTAMYRAKTAGRNQVQAAT